MTDISSSVSVLTSKLPLLSADDKLLLTLLVQRTKPLGSQGYDWRLIRESGVTLSKKLGFSKHQTFRGLSKLREKGLIEEHFEQGKVGRPKKHRKVKPYSWMTPDARRAVARSSLSRATGHLLDIRLSNFYLSRLSNAEFLLLAVLTAFSDIRGVVTGLRHQDLHELTGIPKPQIPRRLSQLRHKGFIQHTVPGLVGGNLLGNFNSIYFLNLQSAAFKRAGLKVETFQIPRAGFTGEIKEIYRLLADRSQQPPLSPANKLAVSSPQEKRERINIELWKHSAPNLLDREVVRAYLQVGMERYASQLLEAPEQILSRSAWSHSHNTACNAFLGIVLNRSYLDLDRNDPLLNLLYRLGADLEEISHELAAHCRRHLQFRPARKARSGVILRILPQSVKDEAMLRIEKIDTTF